MVEVPVERIVEKKVIEYVDRFIEREVIREVPVEKIIVQEVAVYVDKIVEKTVVQEVTHLDAKQLTASRLAFSFHHLHGLCATEHLRG